jgi:hypothetical protein
VYFLTLSNQRLIQTAYNKLNKHIKYKEAQASFFYFKKHRKVILFLVIFQILINEYLFQFISLSFLLFSILNKNQKNRVISINVYLRMLLLLGRLDDLYW